MKNKCQDYKLDEDFDNVGVGSLNTVDSTMGSSQSETNCS